MTTPVEGMEVNVRKFWNDEALDFTPWLACNLDALGIGVKLELVQTEKPVGPFLCDILAKEVDTGANVVIENQLESTDHSHLGQLLTYAAGLDARVAVWVAPAFVYEHAEALHWLNESTCDGRRFYGVKVVVLKAGNELEPRFYPVVTPGCWNKDMALPRGEVDPSKHQFKDFFQPLVAELLSEGFADVVKQRFTRSDRQFPSRHDADTGYRASLEGTGAWVTLHIQAETKERTRQIFNELMEDKKNIEACLPDQEWLWLRNNAFTYSSISIRRDGSIDDPPEESEKTRSWMRDMLLRFKEVFDQRVAELLKDTCPTQ